MAKYFKYFALFLHVYRIFIWIFQVFDVSLQKGTKSVIYGRSQPTDLGRLLFELFRYVQQSYEDELTLDYRNTFEIDLSLWNHTTCPFHLLFAMDKHPLGDTRRMRVCIRLQDLEIPRFKEGLLG